MLVGEQHVSEADVVGHVHDRQGSSSIFRFTTGENTSEEPGRQPATAAERWEYHEVRELDSDIGAYR